MHGRIPLYWEILILLVENYPMLQVSVCSCSLMFYPPVGVSPCGWCLSELCCDELLCVQLVSSLYWLSVVFVLLFGILFAV